METLKVSLGERSYPIYIKEGAMSDCSLFSSHIKGSKVVVITNETIMPLYQNKIASALQQYNVSWLAIKDGESYKNLATFEQIHSFLLENNFGRDVTLIALGGGVIGDLVGFVASTYQRGVEFIQVPTTLLSQVDSSVGGKTAVNHPLGKNMIGAFYQPKAVIIDTTTLSTLPRREFSAGMAEVIKYGILGNASFFDYLQDNKMLIKDKHSDTLAYVIKQCCQDKANIVAQDEKEQGVRALLNLGHTFGHAIEAELGYGKWLHGEAVSAGMVQACQTSQLRGWLSKEQVEQVCSILAYFDLPISGPKQMNCEHYLSHMRKDKKVQADTIRFVLPKRIGEAILVNDVTEAELAQVL